MKTRELLQALLDRDGLSVNALAARINSTNATQPKIHRFLRGITQKTQRPLAEALAEHYGITPEAFYVDEVAQSIIDNIAAKKPLMQGVMVAGPLTELDLRDHFQAVQELEQMAILIRAIPVGRRKAAVDAAMKVLIAHLVPAETLPTQEPAPSAWPGTHR